MTVRDPILYLSRADVAALCQDLPFVGIIREVFALHAAGQAVLPPEACLRWHHADDELRSLAMPGYIGGRFDAAGAKVINNNVSNVDRGLPRADGITILFEVSTGRIRCILEGALISSLRTAAVTMLAIDLLAPPAVESVALIGAGVIADAHLKLLRRSLAGPAKISLYDKRRERAQALQSSHADEYRKAGWRIEVGDSAESAIRPADLVITATNVTRAYIGSSWLKPGCLFVNVSLDDLERDGFLNCDLLVVDDWSLIRDDNHRLLGRLFREGVITGPGNGRRPAAVRAVDAELGELLLGCKPGRTSAGQIIVVNPFGLAIEDVAVAAEIEKRARSMGVGSYVPR
jgi:ornithine cyclodeaminase